LTLKNLDFKFVYDSDEDDILNDFYIPVLSKTIKYKRLCGTFSSTSLAIAARGISELIKNDGCMEIICSSKFNENDIEMIKQSYSSPEEITVSKFTDEFDNLEEGFIFDHVRALGWLLANNLLKIKIAIPYNTLGFPLSAVIIKEMAMFHQKVGILEDKEKNIVTFSGSQNESLLGWTANIEGFKVFRSWISEHDEFLKGDLKRFNKFWEQNAVRTKIIDLPSAIFTKLVECAPKNKEEIKLEKYYLDEIKSKHIKLRPYQKEARDKWFDDGCKGIFKMATGSGKTFTALSCLNKLFEIEDKLIAVIACPLKHLVTQWAKEIDNFGIDIKKVIIPSRNWKSILNNYIMDIELGIRSKIIILTTHTTFSKSDFYNIFSEIKTPTLSIIDEVHGIGAPDRRKGLRNFYNYRLGLSATPERPFDPDGTDAIFEFFIKITDEYPLRLAIGTFLTEYNYYPHFISLTDKEIKKYEEKTEEIRRNYYKSKDDKEKEKHFARICSERADVVKNASNKYSILKEILKQYPEISHCLIYCSPAQLKEVGDILSNSNIKAHKFTQDEDPKPSSKYKGKSERDFLKDNLANGVLQVLIAIKCLDEGVDIPQAKIAIMMSNSGNPREFIQRRGRVLRLYPDKKIADIHDIIVIPQKGAINEELKAIEQKIFSKELNRYREFSDMAKNRVYCKKVIEEIEDDHSIYW